MLMPCLPTACVAVFMSIATAIQAAPHTALTPPTNAITSHDTAKTVLEYTPGMTESPTTFMVKYSPGIERNWKNTIESAFMMKTVQTFRFVPGLHQYTSDLPLKDAMTLVKLMPDVLYVEPDYVVQHTATPNDTYFYLQYAMNNTGQNVNGISGTSDADMDCVEAWDTETGNGSLAIAVIDSGVQWNHPDLDGNIWSNPGEVSGNGVDDDGNGYVDDIRGWDFYSVDSNPTDGDGHGTHVAGTIAAECNNNSGVCGVMWDADIVPLRFIGPYGGYTSDAILAIEYCIEEGITISNNSWGGGGYSTAVSDAILSAQSIGHLFVAAAGNDGSNTDSNPHYPSSYSASNIISVAATDNRDRLAGLSIGSGYNSNYGANSVDIAAPGVNIASTYPTNSYAWLGGTSMATPHVSGIVGLIRSQNPSASWGDVRDQLLDTARSVSALSGKCVTGGVANAEAALDGGGGEPPANTAPSLSISSPANGTTVTVGDSVTFSGSASDAEDGNLSSSITWSSNIDGSLGTGASVTRSDLSVGTHTITANVSDSGSLSDSDSISLTVEDEVEPPVSDPPGQPGRPVLVDLGDGVVQITWTDPDGLADDFQLQRRIRIGNSWTSKETIAYVDGSITTYVDSPGIYKVKYRVRGRNAEGNSSWSRWKALRLR